MFGMTVLFSYSEVSVSCSVASDSCDPLEHNLQGSSLHGIFQARILEWVVISFSNPEVNTTAKAFYIHSYFLRVCFPKGRITGSEGRVIIFTSLFLIFTKRVRASLAALLSCSDSV